MKFIKLALCCLMLLLLADSLDAQRRSRTRSTRGDQEQLAEKWLSIHLGNIGFGSGFSISSKLSAGIELQDFLSVGAYGKFFYDTFNRFGAPNLSLFSPGFGGLARINVTDEIFLQGEYSYTSFDQETTKDNIWYPLIGGGYLTGNGDWTYGFTILLLLTDEAQTASTNTVEYWIDFNYKF